jgi:5,10-methylenetetrahydrofolate reductase
VTRGRSRSEIAAEIESARSAEIDQVLCILGDHAAAEVSDAPPIRDVIAMTAEAMPGACVGATLNQYGKDPEAVIRNLLPKLRAGATYVQTQPAFQASAIEGFAAAIDRERPETRVIAMAMPLLSLEAGERLEQRLGITLPASIRGVLESGDEERAWAAFSHSLESLVASPHIDGVAIMTFEMDATEDTGARIVEALKRAGAVE